MRELYNEIVNNIEKICFEKLWAGFHKYEFALYTSQNVLFEDKLFPWDDRFLGNTTIQYEGSYIAIWNVENDFLNDENEDIDILTANLIHEMFHAYQCANAEKRFPRDLLTLDYPNNIYNYSLKYEENKVLVDAFYETDIVKKKALLNKFYSIRQNRQKLIGDMCRCEYLLETAEGMAEYIGTMALKQLSEEKYHNRMKSYADNLYVFSPLHLDSRRISYYSGAIFLIVSHDLGIEFMHTLSNQDETVFEIISKSLQYVKLDELQLEEKMIEKFVHENIEQKKLLISKFFLKERVSCEGHFYISGYDPMNMIKIDNQILCKTFIRLTDVNTGEDFMFLGETLLYMKPETIDNVTCYYR